MVGPLAREHDLLLVDLPGCGESDRPEPSALGPQGYSPRRLAAALLEALREEFEERPLPERITLVGHSLGAAVVLRLLGDPALRERNAALIERVDSAVLISTPDCSYAKRDPVFERIANVSGAEIAVGNLLGLVRERIASSLRDGVEDPAATPREETDRMWEVLCDPARLAAAQSMLLRAVPFLEDLRPDWRTIEALGRQERAIRVPCLLVCGGRDDVIPDALSFRLAALLPDARLRVLARSGHCLPVERPAECASLILGFAGTRGTGWSAYEEVRPGTMGYEVVELAR
jgi:pimeloyl-ACP methyl ester carboxylesterase